MTPQAEDWNEDSTVALGRCRSCGRPFLNEDDIQFEYCEPLRHAQDWARQHACNVLVACASCCQSKRNKPFAQWLDELEAARLSNEAHQRSTG